MTALPHTLEQLIDILNASNRLATPAGGDTSHDPVSIGAGGLSSHLAVTAGQVLTLSNISHSEMQSIGANDHHNRQHSIIGPSDHVVVGSALDVVGLSAANTLSILTPSANPGVNSRLLKSDAAGGLILQALQVQGAVDITNGGNFAVGTNVLFVNNSGQRVGINRSPDAQFQLDIEGNIRWSGWGVGKMAIQISGALMICHYDGKLPYETNYTGTPLGHMGQEAVWSGGVVFRPGKFGTKAVQLAEATTNLITNPSFEVDLTGWGNTGNDGGYIAFLRQAQRTFIGGFGLVTTPPASPTGQNYAHFSISVSAGTTYTISVWVWTTANNYTLTTAQTGGTTTGINTPITGTGGWQRVSQTITTVTGTTTLQVRLRHDGTAVTGSAWWDGVQVEQKGYATPYCDGSLDVSHPLGTTGQHSWSGTAHSSTSSRVASHLTYKTAGNILAEVGTVMGWVNVPTVNSGNQTIFRVTGSTAGFILLRINSSGFADAFWGTGAIVDSSAVIPTNTWVHLAMTYDGTTLRLYKNGVQVASGAASGFSGMPTHMHVGRANTATAWLNGFLDDLIIVDRAVPADEIRSIYESDAPVFAETSSFNFTTPNQLVWADENGLFMRRSDGQAAFGVIGVDGHSWGGQTLDMGDLMLGNTSGANFFYDISTGRFNVRGGTTVEAYIDTDGSIKAGGGTVTIDSSGILFTSETVYSLGFLFGGGLIRARPSADGWLTWQTTGPYGHNFGMSVKVGGGLSVGAGAGHPSDQAILFGEAVSTPGIALTANTQMNVYMRGDKFVIQFNNAGTVRYKYLDLTGTGVTWVHSTTPP